MRETGKVLTSGRLIRAIVSPSSLDARRRANCRYLIRKAVSSAANDIIFIHRNGDAKMKRHVEDEIKRMIATTGTGSEFTDADSVVKDLKLRGNETESGPESDSRPKSEKAARIQDAAWDFDL